MKAYLQFARCVLIRCPWELRELPNGWEVMLGMAMWQKVRAPRELRGGIVGRGGMTMGVRGL